MKYTQGSDIPKPKLYRLAYYHEGMGCIVRYYTTKPILMREKLIKAQHETPEENGKIANARFWIMQEVISNTDKEIWSETWHTIERSPEMDMLFAPEAKTELEKNIENRF